jgi:hypothetical protein
MSAPHPGGVEALAAAMAWTAPGIAPLLWAGSVLVEGAPHDALVEALPAGVTLEAWRGDGEAALRLARQLAEIVRGASARGFVLGGLRPELIFVADGGVSGVAPRAPRVHAGAAERSWADRTPSPVGQGGADRAPPAGPSKSQRLPHRSRNTTTLP